MISFAPTLPFIITFVLTSVAILQFIKIRFRQSGILQTRVWYNNLFSAWFLNIVCFGGLAIYFMYRYHFITDDVNYFYGADEFTKGFFEISTGTEFMCYITKPLKTVFHLDRPALHTLFGTLGFIGSMNYLTVYMKRSDMLDADAYIFNRLAFFMLLCFPNFMLWGRVFGKDSTMFFLASLLVIGAYRLIEKNEINIFYVFLVIGPLYIMQLIRPHVAGVIAAAFGAGYIAKVYRIRSRNIGIMALAKIYVPIILIVVMTVFIGSSLRKLGVAKNNEEITAEAMQDKIMASTMMGGYGGSSTELASEMKENPRIIFQPQQIAKNIGYLLFAPLPWQVRGGADALAFLSNVILFYLLYKYGRKIKIYDPAQIFFLAATGGLMVLLSFMTGNIGLLLRQKTILLPFLFLLLFSRPVQDQVEEHVEEESDDDQQRS
ncbi:MAG: hypothetical protein A2487_16625 [Candidatus Raymondbacteria bacterium RifOxyC12_full_50_8]|nr:MAG: hypothetical protein A2350_13720 [Candidatus Raymondbacteria bacterium RifOxyB12_full_50_8]OGJ94407.1 MAG: hypothetical protein A2487_16625 [Candidatus Raymondbacteria bacterium RifOxyC12_full_50_8]